MKTTGHALRNKATHEIVTVTFPTKAAANRVLKASGRTDLEVTAVNW